MTEFVVPAEDVVRWLLLTYPTRVSEGDTVSIGFDATTNSLCVRVVKP